MSKKYLVAIVVSLIFIPLQAAALQNKIIFSFGSHNAEPYTISQDNNLIGGIIWDIGHELAKALNAEASFIKIPRKRQFGYLETGKTHVLLISNPAWLNSNKNIQWSAPLFIEEDIIVTHANNPLTINSKQNLYGLRLGAIRGYKYPLIDGDIEKKLILRDDVRTLNSNFEKLLVSRIDVFIDSSILINYRLAKRKDAKQFRVAPLSITPHNIQAAISPKSTIKPKDIISALAKLKNDGVIDAILHKYK